MKRFFYALQLPLFLACNFFIFTTVLELTGSNYNPDKYSSGVPEYNGQEEFDPSLQRLNSLKSLERFCDSLFLAKQQIQENIQFEEAYPEIVVSTVRRRFYHGYSTFGLSNNFAALAFEPLTGKKASAIVLPDQLLKYSYAACSQQSIVVMSLLKEKGFISRVVGFSGKRNGHFSFETYYKGGWHFFDPNMEPDQKLLDGYNRPSMAFLASNTPVLMAAYKHLPKEMVLDIFPNYTIGEPNVALAPWATLYQNVTQFLSYTLWSFFLLAFILVRIKYRKLSLSTNVRHSRIYFSHLHKGTSAVPYPNYTTQGA